MNIKEYLETMVKFRAPHKPEELMFSCVEEFVLKYGVACSSVKDTHQFHSNTPKECYKNAALLAVSNSELIYVEGYVNVGIPIMHAWCIDSDSNVYEPTLNDPVGLEYFGVPFKTVYLLETITRKGTYGILDNYEEGFPVLRIKNEDFLENLK